MSVMRREGHDPRRFLEPFEHDFFEWPQRTMELWRRVLEREDSIKVEEFIDGNELVVRAELPGVDPDRDIQVSVVDGALSIRAERRQEHAVEERHMRRAELRYGAFSRTIALPPGTKESEIKASYKDGVLEVRAPIEEHKATSSTIPIQHG